ncbi:MAG TPA: response regulator [Bryobacteraceae bacterium]|nr:response regulator [Bryobacteraceae bacterium]
MVREIIRAEGLPLAFHLATDGQAAIDFIARAESDANAPYPHFLMLDLNLPGKDGFEVLRYLRASHKCKRIPVLIFTSSDAPGDQREASALGAKYFCKPPSYEEFLKLGGVMKELLAENRLL